MGSIRKILLYRRLSISLLEIHRVFHSEREIPSLLRLLVSPKLNVMHIKPTNHSFCQWSATAQAGEHTNAHCCDKVTGKRLVTRLYSSASEESRSRNAVVKNRKTEENTQVSTSVVENIKETTKTVSYTGVIIVVIGVAFTMIYAIVSELFSSKSPHKIYSKTYKLLANDPRVQNVMGDQIKGFGEETRRGRRQHVSHLEYSKNGRNYLRMKFYIKGNRGHGSVHLEMIENDEGAYEYRYLFIVVDSDPNVYKKTIILEDNRGKYDQQDDAASFPALDSHSGVGEIDLSLK